MKSNRELDCVDIAMTFFITSMTIAILTATFTLSHQYWTSKERSGVIKEQTNDVKFKGEVK